MVMDLWRLSLYASPDQPPTNDAAQPAIGAVEIFDSGPLSALPTLTPANWNTVLDSLNLKGLDPSPVTYFRLTCATLASASVDMLRVFTQQFPCIRHLVVGSARIGSLDLAVGAGVFSSLLAALTGQGHDQGRAAQLASRLETVGWEDMVLDQATVDALVRMLEARARRGIPLSKLSFKNAVCLKELDIHLEKSELARHVEVEIV